MLSNYLSIAFRHFRQNPLYSFINIFSLSIGLTASIIIFLFIKDERGFDVWHSKHGNLYRLDEVQNFTGTNEQKVALSMPGMGPSMAEEYPEVKMYTRFWSHGTQVFLKGDLKILLDQVRAVDSTFLELFDFKLIAGERKTALDEPNTVLLTEESALKFFPSPSEAIGNTITVVDEEFKITGVLENVPENSHLQFDALISLVSFTRDDPEFNSRFGSNFLNTYLLLEPHTDIAALEAKFPDYMIRHTGNEEINKYYKLFLQPLAEVHLASTDIEHDYHNYRKFNGKYLDVFAIIGVFILLIAAVNFMNLTTARASHRWKEIGVRKTVGARRSQLFIQFVLESVLLAILALGLALLFALAFVPLLNQAIGRELSLFSLLNAEYILSLVGITLALGFLTGIYPSLYLTSFNLASVFKGGNKAESKSIFQNGLVVVQFGLALGMIVSTLIVLQQINFMKNTDVGFEKDQILLVSMNREANEKFVTLKDELLTHTEIEGVTASGQRLGNNFHQWGFKIKGDTGIATITPSNVNVDYDYLEVYGIKLKEGRGFNKEFSSDNGKAFIINDSFAEELNLKETVGTPAGHSWFPDDSLGTIIGVTEDFNFNSLHYKINTLSMVVHPDWGYDEMSVKVNAGQMDQAIPVIKNLWEKHVTSYPFTYTFLDDHFAILYTSDRQMSAVVSIMAGLAILISCMGLFGLASITTEKKTKEIGIRKVLGASEAQITILLSRQFMWLVLTSFVLVSPITYWLLSKWLESFAYRVDIDLILFVLGALVALIIALATISYHTIRSARMNPANTLRCE